MVENLFKYLSLLNGSYDSNSIKDAIFKAYMMTNQELWMAEFDSNLSGIEVSNLLQRLHCGEYDHIWK